MIDQKTSDGKEIYIGDEVYAYKDYLAKGKHRIIKSKGPSGWAISGLPSKYGVRLMLA